MSKTLEPSEEVNWNKETKFNSRKIRFMTTREKNDQSKITQKLV